MRAPPSVWVLRVAWLTLPFTAGDATAQVLDGRTGTVRVVGFGLAWLVWAAVGIAAIVTLPVGLTLLRVAAPALGVGAVAVGALDGVTAFGALGAAGAALVAALAWSGEVADHFVDGASYGDERRFALRLPVGFAVGAVPGAWTLMVGGLTGGALLSAAGAWAAGAPAIALGAAVAWRAIPSFHRLSNRWLVMVPAGITLVDDLALTEPVLFHKDRLRRIGPAAVGTDAVDLSGNALGTPLEIRLGEPVDVGRRTAADGATVMALDAVLVSPASLPAVLRELERRSGGVFPTVG